MSVQVEEVCAPVFLGEGPHWSSREQALYFVDIFDQDVHRYHPSTQTHSKMHVEGGPVSLVLPHADKPNVFIISVGRSLAAVTWPDPSKDAHVTKDNLTILTTVESDSKYKENRFNDGKCDPLGRLWAGTMGLTDIPDNPCPYMGSLYYCKDANNISNCLSKVSISNGLAWSGDGKTFYYVDTCEFKVEAFTCDLETAKLSNRRTIYDFRAAGIYPSFPDGLTIDTEDRLWVACYGAGKVICINPRTGKVEDSVTIPTSCVTSVTFGGPNLDQLFVTTTPRRLTKEQMDAQPNAGATFRVTGLKAKGRPNIDCKIPLN